MARPESAVGRCWRAAWGPAASVIHKIDAMYGDSPISGADSLVICSQNRLWNPKLLPPARLARMGVGKRILHPRRPKTACYGLTRRQKTNKPKNAIKPSGVHLDSRRLRSPRGAPTPPHGRFGPRQRLAHRRGHVDGPRTQLYHPHPGTWARTAMVFDLRLKLLEAKITKIVNIEQFFGQNHGLSLIHI